MECVRSGAAGRGAGVLIHDCTGIEYIISICHITDDVHLNHSIKILSARCPPYKVSSVSFAISIL